MKVLITFFCLFICLCKTYTQETFKTGSEEYYKHIMSHVSDRLIENYDSVVLLNERYREFAYIDSTKEIINAVQLNNLVRTTPLFYSRYDGDVSGSFKPHFLSGTFYEKHKDYGYANFTFAAFSTMGVANSYLTDEIDIMFQIQRSESNNSRERQRPIGSQCGTCCLKEAHDHYEVKDTIYNQTDCYLLRKTVKLFFTFDENVHREISDDAIRMLEKQTGKSINYDPERNIQWKKERLGNWTTVYQPIIHTTIVNKADYAILEWSRYSVCLNDSNESRTFLMKTKYKKTGNYYYRSYKEIRQPRILEYPPKGGINDKDIYSLIISEREDAKINKKQEREMKINKLPIISHTKKFDSILKKELTVNDDIQTFWNNFWEINSFKSYGTK